MDVRGGRAVELSMVREKLWVGFMTLSVSMMISKLSHGIGFKARFLF